MTEIEVNRKNIWNEYLYPYFSQREFGFQKNMIRKLEEIYSGKRETDLEDEKLIPFLEKEKANFLFMCMFSRDTESWCRFFRQYDVWLSERFPSDKGKHYINTHKRFVGGLSELIDPIRPLFKPWHFGWTDKEDINYFNFWYSDRADLVTLDLPERWRNILHRGVEDRFCDLCYGLSGYLRGYHSKRGRYSILYAYFKKFFNLIDSEIF